MASSHNQLKQNEYTTNEGTLPHLPVSLSLQCAEYEGAHLGREKKEASRARRGRVSTATGKYAAMVRRKSDGFKLKYLL